MQLAKPSPLVGNHKRGQAQAKLRLRTVLGSLLEAVSNPPQPRTLVCPLVARYYPIRELGFWTGRRPGSPGKTASRRIAAMPRGLAIFDFDCTLTKFHVWGRFRKAPLPEVLIDADTFVDLPAFKAFVQKARSQDLEVAIATFGRRDVVNKALEFALGAFTASHCSFHAIDARRLGQRRRWVVSFSILRPFGPRSTGDAPRRCRRPSGLEWRSG